MTQAEESTMWPEGWEPADPDSSLREELARECGWFHPLRGRRVTPMARSLGDDDVLFRLDDGSGRFALVHLTYKREWGRRWPYTLFFPDLESFLQSCDDSES